MSFSIIILHFAAPTKAPSVVQAFSTGSNKIFLEWTPIPLPFVHGEPLGFRIHVNKVGGGLIVHTTKNNTKDYEVGDLEPLTNYSIQVLEFNKNGDGPLSPPLYVQTMPKRRREKTHLSFYYIYNVLV